MDIVPAGGTIARCAGRSPPASGYRDRVDARLSWLTTFVAVAEELHFGRAAVRLHLSTSAASRHVQQLEEALGEPLFRRSTRAVHLTQAGRHLYADIAGALGTLEQGLRAAAGTAPRSISVAYTGALEADLIPYLATAWDETVHGSLRLHPLASATQSAAIADGTLDVGIQWEGPVGSSFEVTPLWVEPLHVAMPANHPYAGRETIPLVDLASERWLMAADASDLAVRSRFVETCRRHGFRPDIRDVATGHVAQVTLVAAGHGVCLVPSVAVASPMLRGVAFAQLHQVQATLVAVTSPMPRPAVRRLVHVVADRLAAGPLDLASTARAG